MGPPSGHGDLTLGEDFIKAANHLFNSEITFRHSGPIEYLFAHGLELSLKGGLLISGRHEEAVRTFGHGILKLYDAARSSSEFGDSIIAMEKNVRSKWRKRLREARDARKAELESLGLTDPTQLVEFGIYDNGVIGTELPEFRDQVDWLDQRHKENGGLFRYHKTRVDIRPVVQAFGLNDDVVLRTLSWGCHELSQRLEKVSLEKFKQ